MRWWTMTIPLRLLRKMSLRDRVTTQWAENERASGCELSGRSGPTFALSANR